jgi:hypothetical protein
MDKEFMLMYDNHVNPHSSPDCQSLLGSHLYFHYVYLWLSTFDVPVAYFYEQVVTKFRDRRFGQRLYCLGTTVQSEKLVKKLLCKKCTRAHILWALGISLQSFERVEFYK